MISGEEFIEMALSFQGTGMKPHFDRIGFHISGRKMFATYLAKNNTANIFLTPKDQRLFCKMDKRHIYPVPNKWGEKGATTFELNHIAVEFVREALFTAFSLTLKPDKDAGRMK